MAKFNSIIKNNRNQYAYVLVVGNKVSETITYGWWSTEEAMKQMAGAMVVSARMFKKTAGVL